MPKRDSLPELPVIIPLLAAALTGGCILDTEGKFGLCPEGKLVCSVSDKQYAFDSEQHAYQFVGRCEIKRADGGSEFTDPVVHFNVRGEYDKNTLEFAEAAKFEGRFESNASVIGSSAVDPWLFPHAPVAIAAYAGDPQGLAHSFCIDGIPPKYSRIPFTRNVILFMMSDNERLSLAKQASDEKDDPPPPGPPPPPCPVHWVKDPPKMHMPTPGLVYKKNVQGITVYLTSRCGAENVDYSKSAFQVVFEHFDNGWKPAHDYQVTVSYAASGGSVSSQTLPLDESGAWRVKARQLLTQKHQETPAVGDYGPWINFNIGEPSYYLSKLDLDMIRKLDRDGDRRFAEMERRWRTLRPRPLGTPKLAPLDEAGKAQGKRRAISGDDDSSRLLESVPSVELAPN